MASDHDPHLIPNRLSAAAEAAGQRYVLLIEGLRAIYDDAYRSPFIDTPRLMRSMLETAYRLSRTYLEAERRHLESEHDEISYLSVRTALSDLGVSDDAASVPDRVSDVLVASLEHLDAELRVQIERDIAQLTQALRRSALEIHMAASAQGIAFRAAQIQHQIRNGTELRFWFRDRINRKWPSQKFVRTVWRQHLLDLWNETYLVVLAEHGVATAIVTHPDKSSRANGVELSVLPGSALPTYRDLRDEFFHPNSDALVRYRQ